MVGPPFDAEEFVASLAGWAGEGGGSLVHVLAPRPTQPVRVLPAVPDAAGWVPLVAGVLRDGWGVRVDARPGAVAPVLAQADADVVLIATRLAPPEQAPAGSPGAEASGRPTVKASDVIHAVLTDAGLVVTNRTSWAVDLRVRLGRADAPDADLASLDLTLRPGGSATVPVADLGVVGALPGPEAVVRHWSHETGSSSRAASAASTAWTSGIACPTARRQASPATGRTGASSSASPAGTSPAIWARTRTPCRGCGPVKAGRGSPSPGSSSCWPAGRPEPLRPASSGRTGCL